MNQEPTATTYEVSNGRDNLYDDYYGSSNPRTMTVGPSTFHLEGATTGYYTTVYSTVGCVITASDHGECSTTRISISGKSTRSAEAKYDFNSRE